MTYFLQPIQDLQDEKEPTTELAHQCITLLINNIDKIIIGQKEAITNLVICLLMDEHCLLEGLPGVAKTELAKNLTKQLGLNYQRAQFVPDMLPQDLTYQTTFVQNKESKKLELQDVHGKVFTNILVADEINRAPSKVQAALLEVCQEKTVSILTKDDSMRALPKYERSKDQNGSREDNSDIEERHSLRYFNLSLSEQSDDFKKELQQFMVVATMNPIEQEGVYPLSEAQIDRFAFKLQIQQPHKSNYSKIINISVFDKPSEVKYETPEYHFHALYFLNWLRKKKLFSSNMGMKWNGSDKYKVSDIKEKLEQFIDFTHMQKWPNTFTHNIHTSISENANEKQSALKRQLKLWQKSGSDQEKDWAKKLQDFQRSDNYPEVYSGASVRGLQKLIKAIHVRAFIDGKETPNWQDVRRIAPLILGHRIKVRANRYGTVDPSDFIETLLNCFEQ